MRGSKAKAIRREIYGDQSIRTERNYRAIQRGRVRNKDGEVFTLPQIINDPESLRARYQRAKRGAA